MLRLEGVHARYGAIVALRGVSLDVREGELVALIGANGAGKSTLLSTIAGVLRPHQGKVEFRGQSLVGLVPETIVRRGIAMVPETREIFPALSVEENLRLGAYVRKDREEYLAWVEAQSLQGLARSTWPIWSACSDSFRSSRNASTSRPARSLAASSSNSPSRARSCPARSCSCSTSPRSGWRRRSSSRSSS